MSGLALFMIVGPIAMLGGVTAMIAAIRSGIGENPKSTAMLIAGMMATAFGLMLTAFAISMSGSENITQGAS